MSHADPTSYAAFIGLDWADQEHVLCLLEPGQVEGEVTRLDQTPEAIEAWALALRTRFGGRPCAVCVETNRGAVVFALMKYDFLVPFPINPKQLARFRETFRPSGGKDDPGDATLMAVLVQKHTDSLRPWTPEDEVTRSLQLLSEARRDLVDERSALGQRLRQRLKECFPLALDLLGAQPIHSPWFLKLLEKFPTFSELHRASPKTRARYLHGRLQHATTDSAETIHPRERMVREARPLVTDKAVILAGKLEIQSLVPLLRQLSESITQYEKELDGLFQKHPDAEIFQSVPGAGAALGPRLVAAFGTDRSRYANANELQTFSGIAPVMKQSGKTRTIHRRVACPTFLRQTFQELAHHSRKFSPWAEACYRMFRSRGMHHNAALRALAFKWIRILYRCWQTRTAYDEQKYLDRLQQTCSQVLNYLEQKTVSQT